MDYILKPGETIRKKRLYRKCLKPVVVVINRQPGSTEWAFPIKDRSV